VDFLLNLPECNGRIGTFGLCLGGGLAFRAALASPHIRAAACHFATDIHNRGLGPQSGEPLEEGVKHSIDNIASLRGEAMMVWGTQVKMYFTISCLLYPLVNEEHAGLTTPSRTCKDCARV
jgi:dienelactone hydrolase